MTWRRYVRHRVVVNLKTGAAIQGVLYRTGNPLEVKDATVLEPGAEPVQADGAIVIDRDNVDYIQIVG